MTGLAGFIGKRSPQWKLKKLGLARPESCPHVRGCARRLALSRWHFAPPTTTTRINESSCWKSCAPTLAAWLYVMDGAIRVGDARLGKGDAVTDLDGVWPVVHTESTVTLAAFLVDRSAPASSAGTISGR